MAPIRNLWLASLLAVAAVTSSAQTAAEWDSPRVNAIAQKLRCPCGCNLPMSCQMPPHPCPTCKRNRIRIHQMLSEGKPEEEILRSYISEEGEGVLWVTPGLAGKAAPYAAIGFGFGCVALVLRRYLRRRSETPAMDEATIARLTKGLAEEFD